MAPPPKGLNRSSEIPLLPCWLLSTMTSNDAPNKEFRGMRRDWRGAEVSR